MPQKNLNITVREYSLDTVSDISSAAEWLTGLRDKCGAEIVELTLEETVAESEPGRLDSRITSEALVSAINKTYPDAISALCICEGKEYSVAISLKDFRIAVASYDNKEVTCD